MTCNHGDGAKYRRIFSVGGPPPYPYVTGCSYCDHLRQYRNPDLTASAFCRKPTCHRALDEHDDGLCSVCKAEGLADSL